MDAFVIFIYPLIANPNVILPTWTMKYVVTVSDTLGCTRSTKDSVIVQLIPPVRVDAGPSDTSVVVGQPLNLLASGALTYIWNPFTWLNGVNISNPISIPQETIKYFVTGTDQYGCKGSDYILGAARASSSVSRLRSARSSLKRLVSSRMMDAMPLTSWFAP